MALKAINKALLKVFGSRNERLIKSYTPVVEQISALEDQVTKLDDEALKAKTAEFKAALKDGRRPEDILTEAFAVVREVARRSVEMRHFDVQMIGGNVLFEGKIAEMATGEGKTLVATLAAYMVHLTGRRVHIITVNDYLAKRDAEWMAPVYNALGLTVGAIQADMDTAGQERQDLYHCDVTYGTNNEFGFDYLRDNMKTSLEQMVQGDLEYAIVDEVDSILVDEARTPLIISGPAFDDVSIYSRADRVARQLTSLQTTYSSLEKQISSAERQAANARGELDEAKKTKDGQRADKAQQVITRAEKELEIAQAKLDEAAQYYEVELDKKSVQLSDEGDKRAQQILQQMGEIKSYHEYENPDPGWRDKVKQSLRAHLVFEKEKDYAVMEGKVVIVDEFTGRLMHGRQWS
ncbi:MAG: preprotein translocase subunit SecA, partial [Planctomycetota bacterium]